MASETTKNYGIDTGDGNQLTAGLQGYDHARKVAQEWADQKGEPVYLYEIPRDEDDDTESEEIAPTKSKTIRQYVR